MSVHKIEFSHSIFSGDYPQVLDEKGISIDLFQKTLKESTRIMTEENSGSSSYILYWILTAISLGSLVLGLILIPTALTTGISVNLNRWDYIWALAVAFIPTVVFFIIAVVAFLIWIPVSIRLRYEEKNRPPPKTRKMREEELAEYIKSQNEKIYSPKDVQLRLVITQSEDELVKEKNIWLEFVIQKPEQAEVNKEQQNEQESEKPVNEPSNTAENADAEKPNEKDNVPLIEKSGEQPSLDVKPSEKPKDEVEKQDNITTESSSDIKPSEKEQGDQQAEKPIEPSNDINSSPNINGNEQITSDETKQLIENTGDQSPDVVVSV